MDTQRTRRVSGSVRCLIKIRRNTARLVTSGGLLEHPIALNAATAWYISCIPACHCNGSCTKIYLLRKTSFVLFAYAYLLAKVGTCQAISLAPFVPLWCGGQAILLQHQAEHQQCEVWHSGSCSACCRRDLTIIVALCQTALAGATIAFSRAS